MKRTNIILAIILILFCCYYGFLITQLPDRNLPNTLGSSFMPWTLNGILFLLSLLLLIFNLVKGSTENCDFRISLKEGSGVILLTIFVYIYVLAMSFLGFLIITPFFLAVLMLITGSRKWKEIVLVSICATFGIYLFFQKVFQVILPRGEFF